mmetsp:Transcript_606/g.974  ORF Transcript_606/g.974 Transcript_606/m.974 type:complete len:212 (+) Transcript_606:726-1361(+)
MPKFSEKFLAVGSAIAATSAATSAAAGGYVESDTTPYVPPTIDENPFVGFYMGSTASLFTGNVPGEDDPYEFRGGVVAGAFFGFNHALNQNVIVGAELNVFGPQQIQVYDDDSQYTMSPLIEARARLGYMISDNVLAYGFLGVSNTTRGSDDYSRTYALYGHNLGLGAEMMLSDEFSIGAEYTARTLNAYNEWDNPREDSRSLTLRAAFHF